MYLARQYWTRLSWVRRRKKCAKGSQSTGCIQDAVKIRMQYRDRSAAFAVTMAVTTALTAVAFTSAVVLPAFGDKRQITWNDQDSTVQDFRSVPRVLVSVVWTTPFVTSRLLLELYRDTLKFTFAESNLLKLCYRCEMFPISEMLSSMLVLQSLVRLFYLVYMYNFNKCLSISYELFPTDSLYDAVHHFRGVYCKMYR